MSTPDTDVVNKIDYRHPHEPALPVVLAEDGHCRVCRIFVQRDDAVAEVARLTEALDAAQVGYVPPSQWPSEAWRVLLDRHLTEKEQVGERYVLFRIPAGAGLSNTQGDGSDRQKGT